MLSTLIMLAIPTIALLMAIAGTSCSGASPKPVSEVEWNTGDVKNNTDDHEEPPVPTPADPVSVKETCQRFRTLKQAGCSWTDRFPENFMTPSICETSLASWIAPTSGDASAESMLRCWELNCDAVVACMGAAQSVGTKPKTRLCGEGGTEPIEVNDEIWKARRGRDTKSFSELSTSVSEPVEVCGIDEELNWVTQVRCDDGSNPYKSRLDAHDSKDRFLQNGGRCNSVLDRFSVQCPESTYTVYLDRYVCPR